MSKLVQIVPIRVNPNFWNITDSYYYLPGGDACDGWVWVVFSLNYERRKDVPLSRATREEKNRHQQKMS